VRRMAPAVVILAALWPGCRRQAGPPAKVAASNSMLECAARDLLGGSETILRLAEPGMCPGHYDIRPGQVAALHGCRVLLRLDFQKPLDRKLAGIEGLRIAEVRIAGGLCEPESYLAACRQSADALVSAGLLDRAAADRRLDRIAERTGGVAKGCLSRAAGLKGTPVVASVHQESFCRWLGLNVVATFGGADTAGVGQIDRAIQAGEGAGAKLVVANLPEGRRVADALAGRLEAKVVVFGNFPAMTEGQSTFDALLMANTAALLEAAGR